MAQTTAQEILEESLDVAQTKGEWELLNVEIVQDNLEISDGSYSAIKYNVSAFCFFDFMVSANYE